MHSPSSQGPGRRSLRIALAAIVLGSAALAQSETLSLSPSTSNKLNQLDAQAGDPETDWNCLNVAAGGKSLHVVMPRFIPPGSNFTGDVLELARLLVPETVLASTGDIGTQHQNGTIYGVEYKVFTNDPNPVPPPPARLDITADLLSDTGQVVGTMYCFNEAQYAARVGTLGMVGEYIVWCGPLGHGGSSAGKSVQVAGNDNSFTGALKANGAFRVNGDGHTFDGDMIYGTSIVIQFGSHTLGPQIQETALPLEGSPGTASWYQANADYFFTSDVSIVNDGSGGMTTALGVPVSGLVYATGSISVDGNNIAATATFVAEGGVEFLGNECTFAPAVDEVLAYSVGDEAGEGISIVGSDQILTGALIAPNVRIDVSGSDNQISGQLQADNVRIMGTGNSISNVYQP